MGVYTEGLPQFCFLTIDRSSEVKTSTFQCLYGVDVKGECIAVLCKWDVGKVKIKCWIQLDLYDDVRCCHGAFVAILHGEIIGETAAQTLCGHIYRHKRTIDKRLNGEMLHQTERCRIRNVDRDAAGTGFPEVRGLHGGQLVVAAWYISYFVVAGAIAGGVQVEVGAHKLHRPVGQSLFKCILLAIDVGINDDLTGNMTGEYVAIFIHFKDGQVISIG